MKIVLIISRIIVGLLFIFSGLVKANDPLGLSYKMQEFFEVWGWNAFNDYTLILSLLMNGFEIIAGVAVLLGWRMKTFSWLLLLLIIFFTFLTGYAVLSGKIKTCGCFGDCLPLTPIQSFLKDIFLLILIVIIFIKRRMVQPLIQSAANGWLIFLTVIGCVVLQWYVLKHLPIVDCLPYKKGNNLLQQMQVPKGFVPDSSAINFVYKKDGKEVEFDLDHFPEDFNDSTYVFIDRVQRLVRKGTAQPPITDFTLVSLSGTDTVSAILNQPNKYVLVMLKDAAVAGKDWARHTIEIAKACAQKSIPVFVVTATMTDAQSQLFNTDNIYFLTGDATIIKTAARDNPTFMVMQQANVLGKYANADYTKVLHHLQ